MFCRILIGSLIAGGFGAVVLRRIVCVRPAVAEMDLSGDWVAYGHEDAMERGGGPYAVDYLGLPLTEEGRAASTAVHRFADRQAGAPVPVLYVAVSGRRALRLQDVVGNGAGQRRTIAWHISGTNDRAPITIWMDGRPDASQVLRCIPSADTARAHGRANI